MLLAVKKGIPKKPTNSYISLGYKPWHQGHKALALSQHHYYAMTYDVYFTGLEMLYTGIFTLKLFKTVFIH